MRPSKESWLRVRLSQPVDLCQGWIQPGATCSRRWTVAAYIREEVERQGHDTRSDEGRDRCDWMADAWGWARVQAHVRPRPTLEDIIEIGRRVEPGKNHEGLRTVGVRTSGGHIFPRPEEVPDMLARLLEQHGIDASPIEWYRQFEEIHPFRDGNGRTGKVLLAWLSGTFDNPYFPPADLFGAPIRNP